jgi:hypothetical protein
MVKERKEAGTLPQVLPCPLPIYPHR